MTKLLITRIRQLEQYNESEKIVQWNDSAPERWRKIYGCLNPGDKAFFIAPKKLLFGNVAQIDNGISITCNNVQEIHCSNDQLLQSNEIYPELISRVKASFHPFLHPHEINFEKLISDLTARNYVSYYMLQNQSKYFSIVEKLRENDRVIIINQHGRLEDVKLHSKDRLVSFPDTLGIKASVMGLTLSEILEKNKSIKRKSEKSNNVKRIQKIIEDLSSTGVYKFQSFFSYYDAIFNKKVYNPSDDAGSVKIIRLLPTESVYKISMSGKAGEISEQAFEYFNERNLIVVHGDTKSKGVSNQTQGNTFSKQMKIGDFFYLCRGNSNMEILGRITDDAVECELEEFGDDGWLQRPYEIIADAIREDSYSNINKWWAPNNNSTCIRIRPDEIDQANELLFIPFFNSSFHYEEHPDSNSQDPKNNTCETTPLNTILYGPPGTGKTYHCIDKAVEIAAPNQYKSGNHDHNKYVFDELRKDGQIEFVTFHQNYSYEDFVVGIVPDVTSGILRFNKRQGIFKVLSDRATQNWLASNEDSSVKKKYVLVVDEINRANISKVFGELITLLEDDKRLGETNELKVTLPNGEKDFGIPPNLYLVGTMNTADKSIALVDIALRRRFEFIGYYPKYDDYDPESASLLKTINDNIYEKKKSADFLIGHAYFMKDQSIETVLKHKVIPLLMEYFSCKTDLVKEIFTGSDWDVNYNQDTYDWLIKKI